MYEQDRNERYDMQGIPENTQGQYTTYQPESHVYERTQDTALEPGKKKKSGFRYKRRSDTKRWERMGSAGYRGIHILNVSGFMISTISWHRMRIRMLFLKTGVISSTILTAASISS